jgi:predicted RNA-binding protein with TRAM domain
LEERDLHTSETGGYSDTGGSYRSDRGYGGGYGGRGRSGFGAPRPFRPAPVKVGEEFDVKIESMSKRGDAGVAKVEGLVIFVAGTKVGDQVRIKITRVGRGYATAEITGQPASTATEKTTTTESQPTESTTTQEESQG